MRQSLARALKDKSRNDRSPTLLTAARLDVDAVELLEELRGRRATGHELFAALFSTWCHNPVATFSLCLLTEAYELAHRIIATMYVNFRVWLFNVVQL